MAWCGVMWCGVVSVVLSGVSGVMWCGVVWCGVMWWCLSGDVLPAPSPGTHQDGCAPAQSKCSEMEEAPAFALLRLSEHHSVRNRRRFRAEGNMASSHLHEA